MSARVIPQLRSSIRAVGGLSNPAVISMSRSPHGRPLASWPTSGVHVAGIVQSLKSPYRAVAGQD